MRRLQAKELGHYLPSFFCIKINTDEGLDNLNQLISADEEAFSTFIHEYIHFLQDILTTWGTRHITHTVDILKEINKEIYSSNVSSFKIPFIMNENSICAINKDLVSLYVGDDTFPLVFDRIVDIKLLENRLIKDYEHLKYVQVSVENIRTGERGSFHFGSICIVESMAYLIESSFSPDIKPPQFPYRVVELLTEYIYPEIAKEKINILALCDVALNTTDPANTFIDFLYRLKKDAFIPKNPRDIFLKAAPYSFGKECLSMGKLFQNESIRAERSLKDYFTNEKYNPAKDWISATMNKAREIRCKEGFSFVDLVEDRVEGAKKIISLVKEIGTPLMGNNQNVYWSYHPQTGTEGYAPLFKAINEIYNILLGFQVKCSLKEHCKRLPEGDITCGQCDTAPWEMVKKERLCSFAQIWHMWGLGQKNPILDNTPL